jgi:predicted phosphodiesterase
VRLALVSDLHLTMDPAISAAWHNAFDFAGLPDRLDRARAAFAEADADAVVALGDVTHAGDEASARFALERLCDGLDTPVLVVAGNHDQIERDDQLERCLPDGCELLAANGARSGSLPLSGVAVERDAEPGRTRWREGGELVGGEPVSVVASHFPVISRADRFAERGLAYPRDLSNREELRERLLGASPVVVLSGHVHARESHAEGNVLQLSAGALVEAPYELAMVDVEAAGAEVRVRRRVEALGPPPAGPDPVLAPADETWTFDAGEWRRAPS